MRGILGLMALGLALATSTPVLADGPGPTVGPESVQDLIFLGDHRPIFLRLRMTLGDRAFRAAWMDSVKAMHAFLDFDGNGTVSKEEADRGMLATLVRLAGGEATAMPRGELDVHPQDGMVSIEELADALRTALGPFRVEAGKVALGKTDALFEQLDLDKDGQLGRHELGEAPSTLHRLDLDENERIEPAELEPFANPSAMHAEVVPGRRGKYADGPPVVELMPVDSSLRPVRQLLKKYDQGTGPGASSGDNKLTLGEFAIDPMTFRRADADSDRALDTEELRRFLSRVMPDLELDLRLSADANGPASVVVGKVKAMPPWAKVETLGGGDLEIAADEIRLEVHVEDGAAALADARRTYMAQLDAADTDNNGYVGKSEVNRDQDHPSPLAGIFDLLDRDGDGKLYPKELGDFVDRQAEAARNRIVLTASDQGRALFSILDVNRDRRLGLREVRGTLGRVTTWDRDGDQRIVADEIPHVYQLTIGRGQLSAVGSLGVAFSGNAARSAPEPAANSPNWFRRMDRNRDGDISPREFRGPRAQFDRLDRDKDGLIDASEAAVPATTSTPTHQ